MPDMWWWGVWGAAALLLLAAYLAWLGARVGRLHRRARAAAAALDAALVRRAAAAAVLADQLVAVQPAAAADLYATARAALDAELAGGREAAENDLTLALRGLPGQAPEPMPGWAGVVTASRRVGLARQVHTDVVRDALAVRRRIPVRLLRLAHRYEEPGYFDVGEPGLDDGADPYRTAGAGAAPDEPAPEDRATRA
jgi:hypothetical protein